MLRTLIIAAVMVLATSAQAAPQPNKAVGPQFFTGRWYEIARSPNVGQRDCHSPTYEFAPRQNAGPRFTLTCRKGSPAGPAERLNVSVRLPKGEDAARFKVTALGGVLSADYVVLDLADDLTWAIMTTRTGDHVWLLARRPSLPMDLRSSLVSRIGALGYDIRRLIYLTH